MVMVDYGAMPIEDVNKQLRELPQVDLNEQHLFADGMYCRQVTMPKGSLVIGHIHKKEAINVLASGKILIKTRREDEWEEISAPFVNSTKGGMRKIIYVLEDAYFMNIFRTENTTLDKLYDECVEEDIGSKPYLQAQEVKKQLGGK
jgi:hypothetical protein